MGSLKPFAVAKTEKECVPPESPVYVRGLTQEPALCVSSLQVNVAPGAVEWNVNEAFVRLVRAAGPLSMMVSGASGGGGVVTETVLLPGDWLPAPSCAFTTYACVLPAATVASVYVVTAPTVASAAPSRRTTLLVTPMLSVPAFQVSETDVDVGVVPTRFVGAVGKVRSIVHVDVAGVGSATPPADASTEKLCGPAERPENDVGLAHATQALPSRRQVNVAVLSVEWKVKEPVVSFVKAAGPLSITVSGGGLAATATSARAKSKTKATGIARSDRIPIEVRACPTDLKDVRSSRPD